MKTIKINTNYLNVLPTNCIFNKKVTGCGGTSVAIFGEYVDCSYGYKVWSENASFDYFESGPSCDERRAESPR